MRRKPRYINWRLQQPASNQQVSPQVHAIHSGLQMRSIAAVRRKPSSTIVGLEHFIDCLAEFTGLNPTDSFAYAVDGHPVVHRYGFVVPGMVGQSSGVMDIPIQIGTNTPPYKLIGTLHLIFAVTVHFLPSFPSAKDKRSSHRMPSMHNRLKKSVHISCQFVTESNLNRRRCIVAPYLSPCTSRRADNADREFHVS